MLTNLNFYAYRKVLMSLGVHGSGGKALRTLILYTT
jgi:hypothetical protein